MENNNDYEQLALEQLEKLLLTGNSKYGTAAEVYATLALKEQQRLANVIELWKGSPIQQTFSSDAEIALFERAGWLRKKTARLLGTDEFL